jgi:hypothetical protein
MSLCCSFASYSRVTTLHHLPVLLWRRPASQHLGAEPASQKSGSPESGTSTTHMHHDASLLAIHFCDSLLLPPSRFRYYSKLLQMRWTGSRLPFGTMRSHSRSKYRTWWPDDPGLGSGLAYIHVHLSDSKDIWPFHSLPLCHDLFRYNFNQNSY